MGVSGGRVGGGFVGRGGVPTQHSFVRRTSDGRFFRIFGCPMDIRSVSEWDVGRPTDVQDVIQIPPE